MQALIHIMVTREAPFAYEVPLFAWLREKSPDVVCYDFDNHSELFLAEYAIQLLEQAAKTLIIVKYEENISSPQRGHIVKLFNKALRLRNREVKVVLNGTDPVLEKMGKVLGENYYSHLTIEAQQTLCQEYFRKEG